MHDLVRVYGGKCAEMKGGMMQQQKTGDHAILRTSGHGRPSRTELPGNVRRTGAVPGGERERHIELWRDCTDTLRETTGYVVRYTMKTIKNTVDEILAGMWPTTERNIDERRIYS